MRQLVTFVGKFTVKMKKRQEQEFMLLLDDHCGLIMLHHDQSHISLRVRIFSSEPKLTLMEPIAFDLVMLCQCGMS